LNRRSLCLSGFCLPEQSLVPELAERVARAGGRLVVVGGWVRDRLIGDISNDLDIEILGLLPDSISSILRPFGFTKPVGKQFPAWRQSRQAVDVSYPRAGTELYSEDDASSLEIAFREASRHRDLTINAIGWDPLGAAPADALIDPWHGGADLDARRLRAVDAATFGSDPLRVLRVARLRARFDARYDSALLDLCRELCLDGLPVERIAVELRRILVESPRPSLAFDFLEEAGQLDVFAPIAALRGTPQDACWHPEGDVYVHTGMVVDRAAEIGRSLSAEDREVLLFAALCHDLGKPETTSVEDGRIRSLGHDVRSAERTRDWLETLRLPDRRVRSIETLVAHHLAPASLVRQGAGARAYRRLARKLAEGGVTVVDLERLARADHLGRSTAEARTGRFEAGESFLDAAEAAEVREGVQPDIVSASQLMDRGILPGPLLGRLLARCREIQDENGIQEADRIVDLVLDEAEQS
jgi:tRNA nucleotidyltransferase (CCA-adding enzyme)